MQKRRTNNTTIRLLPKPKRREEFRKRDNWRPITLLNVVTKLNLKLSQTEWKKFYPKYFTHTKPGILKADLSESAYAQLMTQSISPITEKYPASHYLNFKKAYDSLDHEFIQKTLKTFHFGESFMQLFSTLYKNANS